MILSLIKTLIEKINRMLSNNQNDYCLLLLYSLADKVGKLANKHRGEFKRLAKIEINDI